MVQRSSSWACPFKSVLNLGTHKTVLDGVAGPSSLLLKITYQHKVCMSSLILLAIQQENNGIHAPAYTHTHTHTQAHTCEHSHAYKEAYHSLKN